MLALFALCCQTAARAQQADTFEQEQEIDLDALQEEEGEQPSGETGAGEALLPVNTETPEVQRHPALMLVAFAVLVPLAAMLLPVTYNRPKRRADDGAVEKSKR